MNNINLKLKNIQIQGEDDPRTITGIVNVHKVRAGNPKLHANSFNVDVHYFGVDRESINNAMFIDPELTRHFYSTKAVRGFLGKVVKIPHMSHCLVPMTMGDAPTFCKVQDLPYDIYGDAKREQEIQTKNAKITELEAKIDAITAEVNELRDNNQL